MELNRDLEELLTRAEARIGEAIDQHGRFGTFALVLTHQGRTDLIEDPDPSGPAAAGAGRLLKLLVPLAAEGEIRASAICSLFPSAASGLDCDAAFVDLEHEELIHALVVLPYRQHPAQGWSFDTKKLGFQEPRLFAAQQTAPLEVSHPEFELKLREGWQGFEGNDPEQFPFYSRSRKTSIVASVTMYPLVRKDKLLEFAHKLADSRLHAEQEAAPGRTLSFGPCNVELKADGQVGYVAYAGYDDRCIFRFVGWVTQRKILSLWVSTETRDNERSKVIFDEVFQGLDFCIP